MICWHFMRSSEIEQADSGYFSYEEITTAVIGTLTETQKKKATQVDSIVVQGMSGMMVGLPVGHVLGIPCIVIGREGDKHGARVLNVASLGSRVLFMDDHYVEGRTLNACATAVKRYAPDAKIVATYLYNPSQAYKTGGFVLLDTKHPLYAGYIRALAKVPKKEASMTW